MRPLPRWLRTAATCSPTSSRARRTFTRGRTRDDAAGECFDKCARLMGLPYPGGPNVDRLAAEGNPERVLFPRAWLGHSLDFSFSGLKTAVRNFLAQDEGRTPIEDVA